MNNEPMTLEKIGSAVERIGSGLDELGSKVEKLTDRFDTFEKKIDERFTKIDERFTKVDGDIRGLGVLMEDMDHKFTLISEGQDVIREVLETRVAHIEEILEVNVK